MASMGVTSREEEQKEFVGGMRSPYKSVLDISALRSLSLKIRAAWETLVEGGQAQCEWQKTMVPHAASLTRTSSRSGRTR